MNTVSNPYKNLGHDLPASLVVFLVALPLCLGIALASGASMFSGIIAGVVGGIVIGAFGGSNLSISGPAAGLTTIVLASVEKLGTFEAFLCAVMMAGVLQFLLGWLKAGSIGNFFPSSVIKGMLAAIGIILILKQVPHALGYDRDFEGDESFTQADGENTFTEIFTSLDYFTPGAILICIVSLALLIGWERPGIKTNSLLRLVPAPLLVVVVGVVLNAFFNAYVPGLAVLPEHLVSIRTADTASDFFAQVSRPDFSILANTQVYVVAFTIAIVASLETLLSIEASDKLDPYKRKTPLNKELKAQGIGNFVSGFLGGLPVTSVIVRSSANVAAGARTRMSAIIHGVLLAVSVLLIPTVLNLIPLASLAAILLTVGYKLAKPAVFKTMFQHGTSQFIPFVVTLLAIVFTDLLVGIGIGLLVGLYFVVRTNFQEAISVTNDNDNNYLLKLNKDVSFLNKSVLREAFEKIPPGATLIIDGGHSQFIDHDISETIADFLQTAPSRGIEVDIKKNFALHHPNFLTLNNEIKQEL